MPKIQYVKHRFDPATLQIVEAANEICDEYFAQGFRLTVRQLYYQFVTRVLIKNTPRSYARLVSIVNDGRLAGLIDWDAIEDRTRHVESLAHWEHPAEILNDAARQYRVDRWSDQNCRPEVWIEKEALAGVIAGVCQKNDVPYLACRGYTSQSEMWRSAQRMRETYEDDQEPIVLHLGDHDPSGIDMTRDIEERLHLLTNGLDIEVARLALNMEQVKSFKPPPNPAKIEDSRYESYVRRFGAESWELDALDPKVLAALVQARLDDLRDDVRWKALEKRELEGKELLVKLALRNRPKKKKEVR